MADTPRPVRGLVATPMPALVSFDVDVHVGDTCPLTYYVDDKSTTVYVGEIGTTAIVMFADQALLTLATVTTDAATALLSARAAPGPTTSEPAAGADRPDTGTPDPEVWINAHMTVHDDCPISFQLHHDSAYIVLNNLLGSLVGTAALCLRFSYRGLLEFARVVSEATGAMLDARRQRSPATAESARRRDPESRDPESRDPASPSLATATRRTKETQ